MVLLYTSIHDCILPTSLKVLAVQSHSSYSYRPRNKEEIASGLWDNIILSYLCFASLSVLLGFQTTIIN